MKIVFSRIARADLKEIIEYIKRDSFKYAIIEKEKIIKAIDRLTDQPFLGRIVPEIEERDIRELIFRNYRIIYDITSEKEINILTIHHHARLVANNPAFEGDDKGPA